MSSRTSLIPLILLGLVACSGGSGDDSAFDASPSDASAACVEARGYQSFSMIQIKIFQRQCAFMDCHDAAGPPEAMMDLTGATAYSSLVNVPSMMLVANGWLRVKPFDPAMSYLMVILGQYPGPLDPMIMTMPSNSPLLCKDKRDAIERWIVAGAVND